MANEDLPDRFVFRPSFVLTGHSASINTLAINADGSLLLSGGDDARTILWQLEDGALFQEICRPFHGANTASTWAETPNDLKTFIIGCSDGTLQAYRQVLPDLRSQFKFVALCALHKGAIEDVAFDPFHRRIAAVGGGSVSLSRLISSGELEPLEFSPPTSRFVARCIQFYDRGESVLVSYLESHEVAAYNVEPWELKWTRQVQTRIGFARISPDEQYVSISNLLDGVDAYNLPSLSLARSYQSHEPIIDNRPLQLSLTPCGRLLVIGSDRGSVSVYEHSSGKFLQALKHGDGKTLVQAITTYSQELGRGVIVSGSSTDSGPSLSGAPSICIWTYSKVLPRPAHATESTFGSWIRLFAAALIMSIVVNLVNRYSSVLVSRLRDGLWEE